VRAIDGIPVRRPPNEVLLSNLTVEPYSHRLFFVLHVDPLVEVACLCPGEMRCHSNTRWTTLYRCGSRSSSLSVFLHNVFLPRGATTAYFMSVSVLLINVERRLPSGPNHESATQLGCFLCILL
jgi:hypothetical protein